MILSEARELELTQERLKELLDYDPLTGIFSSRAPRVGRPKSNKTKSLGCCNKHGYQVIGVGGKRYSAHRLAWLFVYGRWPSCQIDHRNMDRCDNRLSNLREATPSENAAHGKARRGKAFKGAYRLRNIWRSAITKNGKQFHLGVFDTEKEAHSAYISAARQMHGEFAKA